MLNKVENIKGTWIFISSNNLNGKVPDEMIRWQINVKQEQHFLEQHNLI